MYWLLLSYNRPLKDVMRSYFYLVTNYSNQASLTKTVW